MVEHTGNLRIGSKGNVERRYGRFGKSKQSLVAYRFMGEFDMALTLAEQMVAPPEAAGGTAPLGEPEPGLEAPLAVDDSVYTADEETTLNRLTEAADEIMFRDDGIHARVMEMINNSLGENAPQGLANSTLMIVGKVEERITAYDNKSGNMPGVEPDGGIPDTILPGVATHVYDRVWELATIQNDVDLSGQVKQQGMTILMSEILDRDDLGQEDAEYMFGGMEQEDLDGVMGVMSNGVFSDSLEPPEESTGIDKEMAAMEEAKF